MTLVLDADRTEEIVTSILEDAPDLLEVARRHFPEPSDLRALAQWFDQDEGARTLSSLKRLCEERSDLHLARAQRHAALLLLEIARGEESATDLARKACNDLLRAPRHVPSTRREGRHSTSKKPDGEEVASLHEVVRGLLGQLGRAGDSSESIKPGPPDKSANGAKASARA